MRHFNLNLGFLFGLGLAGCQVIVGITDRTTGPDAGTPGGGSDGSGGDGTSGSSSSAGGSGSAGKGTAGSGAVLGGGGGGASGSGSGATAGGGKGGTSGSGSGAAAGRGGAPPGAGGSVVGSGGAGTPPVAGSGESFCLVGLSGAGGKCNAPLTCTPKPGTFIGVCTAPCATTADCAPGHFCLPTANGSLCVKDCSGVGCTAQGFACFTPTSGQDYCLPDPWFFGLRGAACHDDSNCLSNYCDGNVCVDCVSDADCNPGPTTGHPDICGILSTNSNAICFHDCSGDPTICSRYFSEPATSCKPISGTLSTCGY